MKWLVGLILFFGLQTNASEISGSSIFIDAWNYVSVAGKEERWIILHSKKSKNEYFQCENMDDVVSCVVPLWTKKTVKASYYAPVDASDSPHPDIEGAVFDEIHDQLKIEKAQAVFKKHRLSPFYIYTKLQNEQEQIIGTACDLIIMLPLTFDKFDLLAKDYLQQVFDATEAEGYELKTGGH